MARRAGPFLFLLAACAERPRETVAPRIDVAQTTMATVTATPAADLPDDAGVTLPIPARAQAPEAPPAGWCGETAIQEALLYLGVWAPQRAIHRSGRPAHPDLYADDIPVALASLGVKHVFYTGGGAGFDAYARWVRAALDAGDPVLAGVKILPTAHPEWGLDHFVLVVGHGEKGLLVNTTWGTREWVTERKAQGISLRNAFYAIRLTGLRDAGASTRRARLALLDETRPRVTLRVTCAGLDGGPGWRLERREVAGGPVVWSEELTASSREIRRDVTVDAARLARFRCSRP